MKRLRHGLVLGKFYPPHAGHHHLVGTARTQCDELTVLVCAATTVWHERYVGGRNPLVEEIADRVGDGLWLLTDHEGVPFEDDGLRDGAELRPWMTGRFRDELTRTGRRFLMLTGSHEERLATAVAAVDALIAEGWHLADPLPEKR